MSTSYGDVMVLFSVTYRDLFFKKTKRFIFQLFIGFSLLSTPLVVALDEQRLWLPSNYERLYLALKKSAVMAEKLDRCDTLLRGTIDLDSSTPENPIFRILCRQPDGRTYNEMVDGNTGKTLTTELVLPELLSDEEKQQLAVENEQRRTDALFNIQQVMWKMCDMELADQTKLFNGLVRSHDFSSPLTFNFDEVTEDFVVVSPEAVFQMDFDALDMDGVKLKYRAKCYVENNMITNMKIRTRREIKKKTVIDTKS